MKKLTFNKPKKVKISTLRNKADKVFSLWQRKTFPFCEAKDRVKSKCGGALQCAHIETRTNRNLRYSPLNVVTLCMGHHRYFHQHPLDFIEFLLTYFEENYKYVMKHKNDIWQMKEDDYRGIIKMYENN
jgi:hypothetical protein